jgi:hypothetical protein
MLVFMMNHVDGPWRPQNPTYSIQDRFEQVQHDVELLGRHRKGVPRVQVGIPLPWKCGREKAGCRWEAREKAPRCLESNDDTALSRHVHALSLSMCPIHVMMP